MNQGVRAKWLFACVLNPKQAAGELLISQQLCSHSRLRQIGMRASNERQAATARCNCFLRSSAEQREQR